MMDKVKEQPTNGQLTADPPTLPPTPPPTPAEAMKQILALAESLGYGIGVVALTPKTGTPVPVVEYLPDGIEIQLMLVRKNPQGEQ